MHLVQTDDFETVKSKYIEVIENTPDMEKYSRWIYKLNEAGELIDLLKKAVSESDDGGELPVLVDRVCNRLKTPMLKSNPLFSRTIECLRQEA